MTLILIYVGFRLPDTIIMKGNMYSDFFTKCGGFWFVFNENGNICIKHTFDTESKNIILHVSLILRAKLLKLKKRGGGEEHPTGT